jgi:hypothetical protein
VTAIRHRIAPRDIGEPRILSFSVFKINERRASRFTSTDRRVFICGDAAHVHSPAGGQGMNTGVQDAENVAWKIAMVYHGTAKPELLQSYAAERIPVADHILELSGNLLALIQSRRRMYFVSRLAPLIKYLPLSLSRPRMERTAQLRVCYQATADTVVFADTVAWTRAMCSSWWPSAWFADPICIPGMRAIDGNVIDAASKSLAKTRLRHFHADHHGSYTAIIFIDSRQAKLADERQESSNVNNGNQSVHSIAKSNTPQLSKDTIQLLTQLMDTLDTYRAPIIPAFVIHGANLEPETTELPNTMQSVAAQLQENCPTARIFADLKQGGRYDNNSLADLYNCANIGQHAVFVLRPDTYIAARMLLSEAPTMIRVHMDPIAVPK